jgi:hypothetical protein
MAFGKRPMVIHLRAGRAAGFSSRVARAELIRQFARDSGHEKRDVPATKSSDQRECRLSPR